MIAYGSNGARAGGSTGSGRRASRPRGVAAGAMGGFATAGRIAAALARAALFCGALTCVSLALAAPAFASWGLSDLSFVDRSYGWAVGQQLEPPKYAVLRTTDGGATWTVQKSSMAFNGTGFDVQFVSRSRGIWVNSYVYSTFSGGGSWKLKKIPGAWGGGTFVDFATPSVVWIAGTYGSDGTGRCVARSADGGRTWKNLLSQRTTVGGSPSGLSAPTASTAYIWSRGLMVTRDAGKSWRKVPTRYGFKLNAWWMIDFPTTRKGWVLRYDTASLLRTTDGGKHWVKQMEGLQQRLKAMDFISGRTGWVVGAAGGVYRTTDGGASWSSLPVPTSEELGSVDFIDARHGWVATGNGWGQANSIYRTANGGATWELVR